MRRFIRPLLITILLLPLVFPAAVFAGQSPINEAKRFNSDTGDDSYQQALTAANKEKTAVKPKRELVYGLTLFDGFRYPGTFCPAEIDTIYMSARMNNVITANKTDVFFWPLTREYVADWAEVNEKQKGILVVSKNGRILKELRLEQYLLFYPEGYAGASFVITGRAAQQKAEAYRVRMADFYNQFFNYYKTSAEYRQQTKGRAVSGSHSVKEPVRPEPPQDYATPLNQGFILNLPPGTYRIYLRDDQGNIVPDSVKKLVSFTRLAEGTGFEIIPEDKWTHPTKSDGLDGNIFARRNQVIYLKPFKANQYPSYPYAKLVNLSKPSAGRGLENEQTWVHTSSLSGAGKVIEILRDGRILRKVREKQYIVKQQPGYTLGYKIVEWDRRKYPNESPTFSAFKIKMPEDLHRYGLRLVNQNGKVASGSVRNLGIVRELRLLTLLLIAGIPLISGAIFWGIRWICVTRRLD